MVLRRPIGQDRFMIISDEELPKKPKNLLIPPALDMLGVAELQEYILVLQAEITRVQAVIAAKDAHKAAAAAFFKTPGA
jgi:uncharacterized small protein (DUF1192 family)